MAYSSGGIIEAIDYNNFLNGTNQLNAVWSTGSGSTGYGQTALATVAATNTVTSTQWATFINTVNATRNHQSGAGTGVITAPVAGGVITYLSTVATSVNTAYTNRLNYTTQGATTQNSFATTWTEPSTSGEAETFSFTRTITFASADQARYFFNAGGQLALTTVSVTNNAGGTRNADLVTVIATYLGGISFIRYASNSGRSGSGGTLNTNNTGLGYYQGTTLGQTIATVTSTTYPYNGDYVTVGIRTNGPQGANGDVGSVVYLDFTIFANALRDNQGTKNIGITWNHRIDVTVPETTYLSNSWGSITVT